MRAFVRLGDVEQVTEILEFEPRCDCTAVLWTDECMKNIIVRGMSRFDVEASNKGLFENGFYDFRRFRSEYYEFY